jgi:hypothetical protein
MSTLAIHPIHRAVRFYEAPIGKKAVMAVTGAMLVGYVLAHKLVNPANKRKHDDHRGRAPAWRARSAAATLGELGYNVKCFCFQDSPRRAHSIAAQGGINAAKNYQNDGDSIYRLFYDTVKGGDFRAREANVYRLAQISVNIIDQCVAQGVPFAREYGGCWTTAASAARRFRARFTRAGRPGSSLLLGAYQALERQIGAGQVKMFPRTEMLDLVVIDGHARGIVTRNLVTGQSSRTRATRWCWHRRLRQRLLSVDQREGLERHGHLAGAQARRAVRQSLLHADSPDVHSGERRLSIQAHADERVAAQRRPRLGAEEEGRQAPAEPDSRGERDYYLERRYPSFGNLVPRDVASRNAKRCATKAAAWARRAGRVSRFRDAIRRLGEDDHRERYGNLFDMYQRITGEDPLPGADAHLSGDPLHDGRPVGGLQPDVHHSGPVRARRGQFLRPRRQPPGRQRADAGPGRRLLRASLHDRRLSGEHEAGAGRCQRPSGVREAEEAGGRSHAQAAARQGQAHGGFVPPRAGQADVGLLRHVAQRARG